MEKKNISAESMVHQIEDVLTSDIDDEKVMMSVEKGEYFGLDPIGSRVWDMIGKPVKVKELVDLLLANYNVDRETCERDILAFLEELHKNGILKVEG
jgi:hypothetical protein